MVMPPSIRAWYPYDCIVCIKFMLKKQEYHTFYDKLDFGICLISADPQEKILFANTKLLQFYDCPDASVFMHLTGGYFRGMRTVDDTSAASLSGILGKVQNSSSFTYTYRTLAGHFRMAEAFVTHSELDGQPIFILQVLSSEMLSYVLQSDGLTGLLGRNDFFKKALDLSDQNRKQHILSQYCPVFFDVTNFREYNRSFGIHAGDQLLRQIADALLKAFPGQAIGHLAADSFAALLKKDGLVERAESICEKINGRINDRNILLKCGIVYVAEDASRQWLINSFDMAKIAYNSIKSDVTQCCAIYTDAMGEQIDNRLYVIKHIDEALKKGYIKVYYQPVVRTLTEELCGFEALARWEDPEKGTLCPDIFIPVLENSRLIDRLDAYIISEVGRMFRERLSAGLPVVPVSFNLSKLDFTLMDPLEVLERTVKKYDLPRNYFNVEITESVMVWNRQNLKNIISKFHRAGYTIWLDDFGSEYASLNALHNYSFDVLKIDMGFFQNFDDKSRKIITSIVTMAKSLGMHTLAEGVENKEQYLFLKSIGCGKIQGYYYGRPLPYSNALTDSNTKGLHMETQTDHDMLETAEMINVACDSPVAIAEYTPSRIRLLTANTAYLKALNSVHSRDLGSSNRYLDLPSSPTKSRFQSFMKQVYANNSGSLTYVDSGQYLQVSMTWIAGTKDHWLGKASLTNLSSINMLGPAKRLDSIIRNLELLYDGLYYLNMQKDQIEVLDCVHPKVKPGIVFHSILESFRIYADELVHPADIKRFLAFIHPDHIYMMAEKSGSAETADLFRIKREDGSWRWTTFHALVLMKTPSRDILLAEQEDLWERHPNRSWLLPDFLKSFALSDPSQKTQGTTLTEPDKLLFHESNANEAIMMGMSEPDPSTGIQKTIAKIAKSLEAERLLIFERRDDSSVFCTYEWHQKRLAPLKSALTCLRHEDVQPLYALFELQQVARIPDYPEFIRKNPALHLPIKNIRNMVSGQLMMAKQVMGFTMVINSSDETFQTASQVLSTLTSFLSIMIRNRNTLQHMEEQSVRDPLTGALNRRGLEHFIASYKGTGYLTLLAGDINNLKSTNDTLGHHAGDMLIQRTAEILMNCTDRDHTFRTGGDEFLLIQEGMNTSGVKDLVHKIRTLTLSSGIDIALGYYVHQGPVTNPDPLLAKADTAMYEEKKRCHRSRRAQH